MSQITWRNIQNPLFTGGNRAIESGYEALQGGVDRLAGIGQTLETKQRNEQTSAALDSINALDTAGLASAQDTGQFQNLGNVDANAIRDALTGQSKVIQDRDETKYVQDQKMKGRTSDALIDSLREKELLTPGSVDFEAVAGNADITDKGSASLISSIKGQRDKAQDKIITDKLRKDKIANIDRTGKVGNILDSVNTAFNDTSMHVDENGQFTDGQMSDRQFLDSLQKQGEAAGLGTKGLAQLFEAGQQQIDQRKFKTDTEKAVASAQEFRRQETDRLAIVDMEDNLQSIKDASPPNEVLSPAEESKALTQVIAKVSELNGGNVSVTKAKIAELANKGIPAWQIENALQLATEDESDIWLKWLGNDPDTDTTKMVDLVTDMNAKERMAKNPKGKLVPVAQAKRAWKRSIDASKSAAQLSAKEFAAKLR